MENTPSKTPEKTKSELGGGRDAILRARRIKEAQTMRALEHLVGGTVTGWRFDMGSTTPSGQPILEVRRDDGRDVDVRFCSREDGGSGFVTSMAYDKKGRR